ncbi:hypothetical protein [Terrabacter carboxydivorans]|uniref:Uncharacterized protein n=1 Tax=Terrabacter carboxydivorans TaxID=619730 RepID=A0ABN3MG89_9MICO
MTDERATYVAPETDYLPQVWHDLVQPEWMAGTGIPLLGTLAGLYLAYRFLKRQLKSDRELRAADRRSEAAGRLGLAVGESVRHFMSLPMDSPEYSKPRPKLDLWHELSEARLHLSDETTFLDHVSALVRDILWAWKSGHKAYAPLATKPDPVLHGNAMWVTFEPYLLRLEKAGSVLRAWDGDGHLAGLDATDLEHVPLPPGKQRKAHEAWRSARQAQYLDRVNRG